MSQSTSGTIYEHFGITETANEGIRPGGLKLTEGAVEFCRFAPQSPILDIGCGNGATVHYLQTFHDLWYRYFPGSSGRGPKTTGFTFTNGDR